MNAIETRGITKTYKDFTLDGLNLVLPSGCIMGLIGENGAGKSTAIRLMLGLARPDKGETRLLGQDTLTAETREEIGVVLDTAGFPATLTAEQIGRVMSGIYKSWDAEAYKAYLKRLDVPCGKRFGTLSRGNKMKLATAAALSHRAKLLILDEATSGLDPVVRDEVMDIICDFARDEELSVLMSSHIVSDLEKSCDYIAFLHKGKLMLCEEKDALLEEYGILRCTEEELEALQAVSVIGKRVTPYGAEAVIRREAAPTGAELGKISIEELFVFMVKEERE